YRVSTLISALNNTYHSLHTPGCPLTQEASFTITNGWAFNILPAEFSSDDALSSLVSFIS
ncbi:hypothetical protein Q4R88_16500, partial [Morganella morganii]